MNTNFCLIYEFTFFCVIYSEYLEVNMVDDIVGNLMIITYHLVLIICFSRIFFNTANITTLNYSKEMRESLNSNSSGLK